MAECAESSAMDPELILDTFKAEPQSKDSLCRLCACNSELLIPIFDGEGLENSLADKIEKYLPIKVTLEDLLPLQVCFHCASTVLSWHELITSCIDAEHKLKRVFCNTISEAPVSPAASRDYDADFCEDIMPEGTDLGTSGRISPDIQNSFKEHSEQLDATRNPSEPESGEKNRCLQEMKLEGISEKLMCQICDVVFTDTSSLGDHIQKAHAQLQHSVESAGTMYGCHLCPFSCRTESDRDCHIQLEHGVTLKYDESAKPDISQHCQFCGRFFRHDSVLNMHSISCKKLLGNLEGPENYSDYVTLDESISFDEPESPQDKKGSYKKSVAKRGSVTSPGWLDKSQIESKFSKKKIFSNEPEDIPVHKRTCQTKSSSEKRVSCAYCIKSFSGKYEAIAHVSKSHRNKLEEFLVWLQRRKLYLKDKLCSICDKTFTSTQEASEHVKSCHKDGFRESFRCELCLIECCDELDLLKHIANHSVSNGGSKFTVEKSNTNTHNSLTSNTIPISELPTVSYNTVKCENMESYAGVENPSGNAVIISNDGCSVELVSSMETSLYSNVSLTPNSTRGACYGDNTTSDVNGKMDRNDLLIGSLLNEKDVIKFKTNSEGGPCYHSNKNSGSCSLELPLLIDNISRDKSNPVNSITHLRSIEDEIVDERIPTPPS